MMPEISEFSYGFALTNEIIGWQAIIAAPIFPTLVEEGRAGGGYDVKLDRPGIPLYLQFKRAECMTRKSAKEISHHKLNFALPFYRFKLTERNRSDQHELLLALDNGSSEVYYAAPVFSRLSEINDAWSNNLVASRSIFIAPQTIGTLDDSPHHVAFDAQKAFLCSNPKEIASIRSKSLIKKIMSKIDTDQRPLRQKIPELIEQLSSAKLLARKRRLERDSQLDMYDVRVSETKRAVVSTSSPVPTRPGRPLTESEEILRSAADEAARDFGALLILLQPT